MKRYKLIYAIIIAIIILVLGMNVFSYKNINKKEYTIEKNKYNNEQANMNTILSELKAGFGIGNSYSNPGTGYTEKYGKINEEMIKKISDSGFSFVRIIVDFGKQSWEEGSYDNYSFPDYFINNNGNENTEVKFTIKDEWWNKLDELLNLCQKYNMTLIICPANYMATYDETLGVYSNKGYIHFAAPNYTMNTYVNKYLSELWKQISEHYKDTSATSLAYEIVNEPLNRSSSYNGELYSWNQQYPKKSDADDWSGVSGTWNNYSINDEAGEVLKNYINSSIESIRQIDTQKLICCPTYAQSSNKVWFDYIYENCIKDNNNTCIAFHFYTPQSICGSYAGMTYSTDTKTWNINDTPTEFSETEMTTSVNGGTATTYNNMLAVKDALENKYPMIITESSVIMEQSRISTKARREWATYINKNLINNGIPFSIFDNGTLQNGSGFATKAEDYGILDRINLNWKDEKMILNLVGSKEEIPSEIQEITIKTGPQKVEYSQGEELDITGGVIKVTYTDGKTEEIQMTEAGVSISGYDKDTVGEQVITVEYKGKSTQFTVKVKEKETPNPTPTPSEIQEIMVKTQPQKVEYNQGEELDITGGVITVKYTDGKTEEIQMTETGVGISGYDKDKIGEQVITVEYKGKSTQFTVKVKEKTIESETKEETVSDNAQKDQNLNSNVDDSIADVKFIPKAGIKNKIVFVPMLVIIIVAYLCNNQYKKIRDIK